MVAGLQGMCLLVQLHSVTGTGLRRSQQGINVYQIEEYQRKEKQPNTCGSGRKRKSG